jgi:DNA-binding MarR family transcriptional regulator
MNAMTAASYARITDPFPGWDSAPALVFGNSHAALEQARHHVEQSGWRVAAALPSASAVQRLDQQARTSLVWIELDEALGDADRLLLERVSSDRMEQRYPAIVAAPVSFVDELVGTLAEPSIELLIDADEPERVAALALAASGAGVARHLSDVASDGSTTRLRQLSEEVNRIASALARLSSAPLPESTSKPVEPGDGPAVAAETVRRIIRARRLRSTYLPADLFADPAWDMLLDLLQAEIVQHRVPVSSLCIAAAVPPTTALRWIKSMTEQGLLIRRDDPHDGRRVFIELASTTSAALRHYFAEVGKIAVV